MREVSILISPDGSEMLIPLFDKNFDRVISFIGVQTAHTYTNARVRHDQDMRLLEARLLKMSKFPQIVNWFSLNSDEHTQLTETSVNWMLGIAERFRSSGFQDDEVVTIADVKTILEGDA